MEMILQWLKKGIELFVSIVPLDLSGISGIKHWFVLCFIIIFCIGTPLVSLTDETVLSIALELTGWRIMWFLEMRYFFLVAIQGDP